nr:hypothetical protein [Tanacetum cinerariifolium]
MANPDDESMWATDHILAPTLDPIITIPTTANKFAIKGMPNYGIFIKEHVSNKHKKEQISSAFLSDESLVIIRNKVPPKLGDPGSFVIPCTFIEVGKFTFLVDFVILEMEEDSKVPLILGRPLLHTIDAVFSIDVIDEILEEDFDALLDEGRKILYSIEGTPLEDKIFAEFDAFIAMNSEENTKPKINEEEITFKKICNAIQNHLSGGTRLIKEDKMYHII